MAKIMFCGGHSTKPTGRVEVLQQQVRIEDKVTGQKGRTPTTVLGSIQMFFDGDKPPTPKLVQEAIRELAKAAGWEYNPFNDLHILPSEAEACWSLPGRDLRDLKD